MSEQTVQLQVDGDLFHAFTQVAAKNACDDSELIRAFMADYVQQDIRKKQYDTWFRAKVQKGLAELSAGQGLSHAEATAHMSAFKASLLRAE